MKTRTLFLVLVATLAGCATSDPVARFWPAEEFIGIAVYPWVDGVKVTPGKVVVTTNDTVAVEIPIANTHPYPIYAVSYELRQQSRQPTHETRQPLPNRTVREYHRLLDRRSPNQALGSHSYDSMVWVEDTVRVSPGQTISYSRTLQLELQKAIDPDALHVVEIPFTVTIKRETEPEVRQVSPEAAPSASPAEPST